VWLSPEREVIYFITFCVQDRHPVLATPEALRALENVIARVADWQVYAAILMPDHVHLLAAPMRDREASVGDFVAAIKRWMRKELSADWQWQKGFFDRLLRNDESAQAKWEYIRENPVRKKLASDWRDWAYSIGFCEPPHQPQRKEH
jgi:REP element-mobilizing transposase RayT